MSFSHRACENMFALMSTAVSQFRALPLGLCNSSLIFDKVGKQVVHYLRNQSIPIHSYMDDLAVVQQTLLQLVCND